MKFGKRFSQAQGSSAADYLGYKALKQALRFDCIARDALGTRFEQVRRPRLQRLSLHGSPAGWRVRCQGRAPCAQLRPRQHAPRCAR